MNHEHCRGPLCPAIRRSSPLNPSCRPRGSGDAYQSSEGSRPGQAALPRPFAAVLSARREAAQHLTSPPQDRDRDEAGHSQRAGSPQERDQSEAYHARVSPSHHAQSPQLLCRQQCCSPSPGHLVEGQLQLLRAHGTSWKHTTHHNGAAWTPPCCSFRLTDLSGAYSATALEASVQPHSLHCGRATFICSHAPYRKRCTLETAHLVPKGIEHGDARLQACHDCSVQCTRIQPAGAVGWRSSHLVTPVRVCGCRGAVGVLSAGRAPPDCGAVTVTRGPLDHHLAAGGRGRLSQHKPASS